MVYAIGLLLVAGGLASWFCMILEGVSTVRGRFRPTPRSRMILAWAVWPRRSALLP
jgi:hypothetical protein